MAQRHTDDGRDVPARPSPPNGTGTHPAGERERERRAAEAPPGSRERSESDATGWSPERDEDPAAREGRYHRAAKLRMAQPRTERGAPPPEDDTSYDLGQRGRRWPWSRGRRAGAPGREPSASASYGPYGRDDRDVWSASGQGPGPLLGDQETYHSLDRPHTPRDYRPWDRTGAGADTPPLGRSAYPETGGRETFHADGEEQRRHEERVHHGPRGERDFGPRTEGRREDWGGERNFEGRHPEERQEGSGPYSGLMGMGQRVPGREARGDEAERRGRWKREPLMARELMTRNVKSVRLDSSLRDVARIMKEEDCGIVPVVDERGRLRGLLTDRDLVIRTLAEGRPPDNLLARDIMTDDVEVVTPDEDIHSIIALMGRKQVRRVPVVERDDRLVGIIAMADIATRADYDDELQEALDRISARRSFWSRFY